jgi:hypothetical protein
VLPAGTVSGVVSVIVVGTYGADETLIELVGELEMTLLGRNGLDVCVDQSATVSAPENAPPPRHMVTVSIDTALAALAWNSMATFCEEKMVAVELGLDSHVVPM